MHAFSLHVCLPWMLLLNFSLFQYLTTTYFTRRREMRVQLLIVCAFLSFASLTVFAHSDDGVVRNLSDISEVCSVLTFLLQITIICRDVNKRVKVRTLLWMTIIAETLVVFMVAIVVLNFADICFPAHKVVPIDGVDFVVQNVSLAFVFFFRFHYSSLSSKGGWRDMWTARKTEIVLYLLLVTHEYPFVVLNHISGLEWEYVEGLYMRLLIVSCLSLTLSDKIRSSRTRRASNDSVGAVAKSRHKPILPHAPNRVHIEGLTSTTATITPPRASR